MPSNSTLHYAAKQLDDRQLEPKTPQQSMLHSNCIGQHMQVDTNEIALDYQAAARSQSKRPEP